MANVLQGPVLLTHAHEAKQVAEVVGKGIASSSTGTMHFPQWD